MAGKTAAPWEIGFPESTDEIKVYPALAKSEIAERISKLFGEKVLIVKKYTGSGTLASGELAVQEKTGETFTLPSVATANQIIGIFSTVAETKVTGAAETIGDFLKAASFVLSTNQHVVLQSNGTNWMIVAGEPKRTQAYGAQVERAAGSEFEPSATRPVFVVLEAAKLAGGTIEIERVEVGGVLIGGATGPEIAGGAAVTISFLCPPGVKWKASGVTAGATLKSSYLTL